MKLPRITSAVALVAALLLGTCLTASPAHAYADSATIRLKGPTSGYTQAGFISRSGTAQSLVTETFQVVNTSSLAGQFRVDAYSDGIYFGLYKGTTQVTEPHPGPTTVEMEPYYTVYLVPGAAETLSVRAHIASGGSPEGIVRLSVTDPYTETRLANAVLVFEESNPVDASPRSQLVTANGQRPVGGPTFGQYMSANPMSPTGSAVFTVTVRNGSGSPTNVEFVLDAPFGEPGWTVSVKQGVNDVTGGATSGGVYFSLAAGKSRVFKVTVKAAHPEFDVFFVRSWIGDGDTSVLENMQSLVATLAG